MSFTDNVILRALRHPRDFWRLLQSHTLTLETVRHETDDVYTFVFTPKLPIVWQAGQHGVFVLPKSVVPTQRRWRPFSIASAPAEKVIQISTRISDSPSQFKAALKALKVGQDITMLGPVGEFYIHRPHTKVVAIAGGIGITPFRSMILDAVAHQPNVMIDLIYASGNAVPVYQNELDTAFHFVERTISYCTDSTETIEAVTKSVAAHGNMATYFLSGSPHMIAGIREQLITLGMRRIITDPFKGY